MAMCSKHRNQPKEWRTAKIASNRGKATGNSQLAQRKDERAAQQKRQRNDSNMAVAVIVTAMAAAMIATMVAVVVAKTMAAIVIAGGTDNNQLKAAAEVMAVVASAIGTATVTEMVMVIVMKTMPTPTHWGSTTAKRTIYPGSDLWQKTILSPWPPPSHRHHHCRCAEMLAAMGTMTRAMVTAATMMMTRVTLAAAAAGVVKTTAMTAMAEGTTTIN
jgi:hypothetical protein